MAAEHRYSRAHGGTTSVTTSAGVTPVDGRHARVRAREPRVQMTPRPRGGVAQAHAKSAAPQASTPLASATDVLNKASQVSADSVLSSRFEHFEVE